MHNLEYLTLDLGENYKEYNQKNFKYLLNSFKRLP